MLCQDITVLSRELWRALERMRSAGPELTEFADPQECLRHETIEMSRAIKNMLCKSEDIFDLFSEYTNDSR